jgi:hypothetical protein
VTVVVVGKPAQLLAYSYADPSVALNEQGVVEKNSVSLSLSTDSRLAAAVSTVIVVPSGWRTVTVVW